MSLENYSQAELAAMKPTMDQILALTTEAIDPRTGNTIQVPDVVEQAKSLNLLHEIETEENKRAIAKQNEEAAKTKICYARPVAGSEHSDYNAFMHLECGEPEEDWSTLMISDSIKNNKCIGCGGTIGRN